MAARPVIGVTGSDARLAFSWWATWLSLRLARARPVRLTPRGRWPKMRFDGFIIGGGVDIDPDLYGGLEDSKAAVDPERDAFELEVLECAQHTCVPVLGICRGMQLMNVAADGNLYADIRHLRKHTSNRRTPFASKTVRIDPDSQLSHITREARIRVNSLHHQAVQRLGHGYRAVAHDADGIVQSIERPGRPLRIGVQWHPEYLAHIPSQRRLIRALVGAASQLHESVSERAPRFRQLENE